MIFDCKTKSSQKQFRIGGFDGGINTVDSYGAADGRELKFAENMWWHDGKLETRPGLTPSATYPINVISSLKAMYILPVGGKLSVGSSRAKAFILRREYAASIKIDLLIIFSDTSYETVHIYTLDTTDGGDINCLVFSDSATSGSGIYAAVITKSNSGAVLTRELYEIGSGLSSADIVAAKDIYAPLVLVNGKGNKYSTLEKTDIKYPAPSQLEEYNLLCGSFRAAYKTDGVSSEFTLPCKPLSSAAGQNITAALETSGGAYTFTVAASASQSAAVNINGSSVVMTVNRQSGVIKFMCGGTEYAPEYVNGAYNNLIIKAYRQFADDDIFQMRFFESFDSRIFLSGAKDNPNLVRFSKKGVPLYFPQSAAVCAGESAQPITAFARQNDELIIFKADEIYRLDGISVGKYDCDRILAGRDTAFKFSEQAEVKLINPTVGCDNMKTILNCANRTVFCGGDGQVYMLYRSSSHRQQTYLLSYAVHPQLELLNSNSSFAADYMGHYILFCKNRAYLFCYETEAFKNISPQHMNTEQGKRIRWYFWNFSSLKNCEIFSSVTNGSTLTLSLIYTDSSQAHRRYLINSSLLSAVDNIPVAESDENAHTVSFEEKPIAASLTSALTDFGESGEKAVDGIMLELSDYENGDDFHVEYYTDRGEIFASPISVASENRNGFCLMRNPHIHGVNRFGISLKRNGGFSVGAVAVKYRILKK